MQRTVSKLIYVVRVADRYEVYLDVACAVNKRLICADGAPVSVSRHAHEEEPYLLTFWSAG
jgi:hypothetical protein